MLNETQKTYKPSPQIDERIKEIYSNMDTAINARNQSYTELHDMRPMQYIDESRARVAGNIPKGDIDDNELMGANVFFQKTQNKRDTMAAFTAARRPRAEVTTIAENARYSDKRLASILRNVYNNSLDQEYAEEIYLDWNIETYDTGTGFLMDYYLYTEKIKRYVRSMNWDTGEVKFDEKVVVENDEPRAKVVPMEQIFFPTYYETEFQNYPWIIYQEKILYEVAEQVYGKFPNWKYVPKLGDIENEDEGEQFYNKRWANRIVGAEVVEVLHRYSKGTDTHDILINGVLMTNLNNPFLYDHKLYPFVPQYQSKIKGFIMGQSLPMRIRYAQDTYNELMNANINRSRSSSHVSFLTSLEAEFESDSTGLWEIVRTDQAANMKELKVQSVQTGDVQMAQMVSSDIDESTVDESMSGVISGETATAIINAMRQSTQNLGPRLIYIQSAVKKHAEMRMMNLLQFAFNKDLKGEAFDMKEIVIEDVKLKNGKKGIQIIRIVDDEDKIPSKAKRWEALNKGAKKIKNPVTGKKEEVLETEYDIVYLTPNDISNMTTRVKTTPGSSLPDTEALDKAMLLELIKTGHSPQLQQYADFQALWEAVLEAYGYNPLDYTVSEGDMVQPQAQAQPQPQGQIGGQLTAGDKGPGLKQLIGAA